MICSTKVSEVKASTPMLGSNGITQPSVEASTSHINNDTSSLLFRLETRNDIVFCSNESTLQWKPIAREQATQIIHLSMK